MLKEYKEHINQLRNNAEEAKNFFLKKAAYTVRPEEIKELLEDGNIKIIDVRDKEDFDIGHLPTAISLPVKKLEENFEGQKQTLEYDKLNIVYCYCPLCNLALKAAIILSDHNYKVAILKGGYQAWAEKLRYVTEKSD